MNISTSISNTIENSTSSGLVSQSKKEAKRLLKHVKAGNLLSVNNLTDAQNLVAIMRGKSTWHELIKSAENQSGQKVKSTSPAKLFSPLPYEMFIGEMHIGTSNQHGEAVMDYETAALHTLIIGENNIKRQRLLSSLAVDAAKCNTGYVYMGEGLGLGCMLKSKFIGSSQNPVPYVFRVDHKDPKTDDIFAYKDLNWVKRVFFSAVGSISKSRIKHVELMKVAASLIELTYYLHENFRHELSASSVLKKFEFNEMRSYAYVPTVPNHITEILKPYVNSFLSSEEALTMEEKAISRFESDLKPIRDMLSHMIGCSFTMHDDQENIMVCMERSNNVILSLPNDRETKKYRSKFLLAMIKDHMEHKVYVPIPGQEKPYPLRVILDECGDYLIEGSAVLSAKARASGFQLIFADRTFNNFRNTYPNEAMSVLANCYTKILLDNNCDDVMKECIDEALPTLGDGANVIIGRSLITLDKVAENEYSK